MFLRFFITNVIFCLPLFHTVVAKDDLEFWVREPVYRRYAKTSKGASDSKNISNFFEVLLETNRVKSQDKTAQTKSHLRSGGISPIYSRKGHKSSNQFVTRGVPVEELKDEHPLQDLHNPEDEDGEFDLSSYSIHQQLLHITKDMVEANVTTEVLGRTAEYNDIVLLKVQESKSDLTKYFRADDDRYTDDVAEKKLIFIVHGLGSMGLDDFHAFKSNKGLRKLLSYYFAHLDKFDLFIIPLANPDGYSHNQVYNSVYTQEFQSRVKWNKNMSPQTDCGGVALDRNFDVHFTAPNVSSCSSLYPGPAPFSEPESRAVRDVLHKYSNKIVAYFNVHPGTFSETLFKGDAVLYPRGYSDQAVDDDRYIDLRGELDECMRNASFKQTIVTVETLHSWYGKVTGTSVDYASTIYGIPFAMELVMQKYKDDMKDMQVMALEEIWGRAIDVIFKNIHKYIRNNELRK